VASQKNTDTFSAKTSQISKQNKKPCIIKRLS
jgi:hypothetical protein